MQLRIATLNVWGLGFGLARDLPQRLRAIGADLAALDVDVAAFQEVWTSRGVASLAESGRAHGFTHSWQGDRDGSRGGLLVLSRLPIAAARFELYRARGLPERFWHGDYQARKGFAELDLVTSQGTVALFVTHLVSQYEPDARDTYRGHRMAQVLQLAARVRRRREPVVAVGDFNLREDQPHHAALLGIAGLRDAAAELDRRELTIMAENPYRRESRPRDGVRIDYVFFRAGAEESLRAAGVQRVFDRPAQPIEGALAYSDHAGLRAEFELGPAPGQRADVRRDAPAPEPGTLGLARAEIARGLEQAVARRDRRRLLAGLGLTAGLLTMLGAGRAPLTRRHLLRGLLRWGGGLAGATGVGALALAALTSPAEVRSFEAALQDLDALLDGREPAFSAAESAP